MLMPAFIDPKQSELMPIDPWSPYLFRTCDEVAFKSTIDEGVLWLRPVDYFRKLEDKGRGDQKEGMQPISFTGDFGFVQISGEGSLDFHLPPHYILSMHGCHPDLHSFKNDFKADHTFAIRNVDMLMRDISRFLSRCGYESRIQYAQIKYQKTGRMHMIRRLGGEPPILQPELKPYPVHFDFFVKDPVFSGQDEWRLVVEILDEKGQPMYIDKQDKLEVEVSPTHFQQVTFKLAV